MTLTIQPGDTVTLGEAALALGIEVWRAHPDWPAFEVSTHGNVRNVKTGNYVGYLSGPRGGESQRGTPNDYVRVRVANNPGRTLAAYVMVLETFVGPRPEDHDADHINFNTLDNRLANLRWLPALENQARKSERR